MDDADRAEALEQQWRDRAIDHIRNRPAWAAALVTHCQNCGAPLPAPTADIRSRWCDADCRDDWHRRQPQRGAP
ncbi:hypothetical protein VSS37_10395 [Candidatus Thiothrix sp. Deng01]|uniref:DksA C4-type domain-containing protein n=1 Tax=Candidatus Thiothrix phosphatis TaxID=3112415 RepID=A0ABU6CX54_9GAMM|nr:hypothetical protein [Candidatus Thiothrix sp. Deng01]MEB4591388.1 hypothetical protein [Candidatus Thiothrix sp. Deng01]